MTSRMDAAQQHAQIGSTESIPGRFARIVSQFPQRLAVCAGKQRWTYAELDQRSDAVAQRILHRTEESPVVALMMDHGAPLIAGILGVLKAGRIYLALDSSDPAAAQRALLADAEAKLLLTDPANAPGARGLSEGVEVIELGETLSDLSGSVQIPSVSAECGAWLMYTSGSSGRPKGVWQSHAGVVHQADIYAELIGITPEDRLSLLTSCNLAASATALFGALLNGAVLCPFPLRLRGVEQLAGWLREEHVSVYHSVPTVFRHLVRAAGGPGAFKNLRWIRLGGEPVLRSDVELFRNQLPRGCRLLHAYSSTETGLVTALVIDHDTEIEGRVPVGTPVCCAEITLLNDADEPVERGAEGRIAVSGPGIAQGYWNKPEQETTAFQSRSGRRRFVSNDLGRWRPDGTLEHLGRADNVVKVRGRRIDVTGIEAALQNLDAVQDAAVAARGNTDGDQRLVAYVVFKSEGDVSSLRTQLRTRLPEPMIPSEFVPMPSLPQTAGGKIDRKALPDPKPHRAGAVHRPMPRDGIERKLARIWESVLGIEGIGRCEDFFEIGGTSIHSAQVISRIEQVFNVALPLSILSERGTIEQLAEALARQTVVSAGSPLVTLRNGGAGLPLFLIHNGKGDISTYGQLARRLGDRTVFALQSPGLDGRDWPTSSIRDMALRYAGEIVRAHPGPYLIGGTCMGGMVAFEIARELAARNLKVALLALIDSRLPSRAAMDVLRNEARDLLRIPRWFLMRCLNRTTNVRSLPGYRRFVANMNSRALRRYRPQFYPGKVTVITTSDTPQRQGDRRTGIVRFARESEMISVPGTRTGLFMPPAVDALAGALRQYIEQAEAISGVCAK